MGRNSVRPSTIPSTSALRRSGNTSGHPTHGPTHAAIHLLPPPGTSIKLEVIAMSRFVLNGGTRRRAATLAAATCATLLPSLAQAHFNLQQPPNWATQTSQGSPQKEWPCG